MTRHIKIVLCILIVCTVSVLSALALCHLDDRDNNWQEYHVHVGRNTEVIWDIPPENVARHLPLYRQYYDGAQDLWQALLQYFGFQRQISFKRNITWSNSAWTLSVDEEGTIRCQANRSDPIPEDTKPPDYDEWDRLAECFLSEVGIDPTQYCRSTYLGDNDPLYLEIWFLPLTGSNGYPVVVYNALTITFYGREITRVTVKPLKKYIPYEETNLLTLCELELDPSILRSIVSYDPIQADEIASLRFERILYSYMLDRKGNLLYPCFRLEGVITDRSGNEYDFFTPIRPAERKKIQVVL